MQEKFWNDAFALMMDVAKPGIELQNIVDRVIDQVIDQFVSDDVDLGPAHFAAGYLLELTG